MVAKKRFRNEELPPYMKINFAVMERQMVVAQIEIVIAEQRKYVETSPYYSVMQNRINELVDVYNERCDELDYLRRSHDPSYSEIKQRAEKFRSQWGKPNG